MTTGTRRAARPHVVLFGTALGWAVATWAAIALVTDVDDDTPALWIGVALTLAAPPVLLTLAVWALLGARRGAAGRDAARRDAAGRDAARDPAPRARRAGVPQGRRPAGALSYTGAALLLATLVTLSGAGAFLYPFHTDGSRAPVLGALAAPWYVVGILELLAGLVLLGAALVAWLRTRRS